MTSRLRVLSLLALLAVPLLLAGCSDDGGDSGSGDSNEESGTDLPDVPDSEFVDMTGESEVVITAKDNVFDPQFVTVSPGTTITFDNRGRNPHNVIPVEEDQFESIPADDLQPGDVRSITLGDDELYPYYCSLHGTPTAGMDGRIRVAAE